MYPLLTVATSVQSCVLKFELSLCWEIYHSLRVIEVWHSHDDFLIPYSSYITTKL